MDTRGLAHRCLCVVLSASMVFGMAPAQALAEAVDEAELEVLEQVLEDEGDELLPDVDGESLDGVDEADEEPPADVDNDTDAAGEAGEADDGPRADEADGEPRADAPEADDEPAADDGVAAAEPAEAQAPGAQDGEPEAAPAPDETDATDGADCEQGGELPDPEERQAEGEGPDLTPQGSAAASGRRSLSAATVSVKSQTYTGKALRPAPTVKLGGRTLRRGTDYTLSYKNNTNAGTATVTIKGVGSYTGTRSATFRIAKASVAKASVSKVATQKYTGKARRPAPTVKVGGRTLRRGRDYTLSYKGNTRPGTATLTITGKGNYKGARSVTFKVAAMPGTWRESGGRWWYRWRDGTYPTSCFLAISGKTYRFDASGWMLTGWQKVGAKWYYFESSGAMVKSKWVGNYYLGKTGAMLTSCETPDGWLVGKDGKCTGKATYKVAFKANGGTGSMSAQTIQRSKKTALKANAFKRSGYAFAGWNTKADGSGKSYKNRQQVKNLTTRGKTVTLYAQWKKSNTKSASVSFKNYATTKKFGNITAVYSYEKPVVAGSSSAVSAINSSIQKRYTEGNESKENLFRYAEQDGTSRSGTYRCTTETCITYNKGGFLSIRYTNDWFAGGVHNGWDEGAVYSLTTGQKLKITQVVSGGSSAIKSRIADAMTAKYGYVAPGLSEIDVSDMSFYLQGGKVIVCFAPYDLGLGNAPLSITIDGDYA